MASNESNSSGDPTDPPERENDRHNGFVSSGDELEPEPMETNEDTVELVIIDPHAIVSHRRSDFKVHISK